MATAVNGLTSVELFYSYAHSDESLCKELQKHLTALKRVGLIRDWYDRKIEPGSEWASQIQEAMERAGIILLLISADFLASQYAYEVELPFALQRHQSGRATVIPVLLRPVEWRDLPFANLQMLPSQARAVTQWPNQDEAFSDVAARLRELLYGQRLREAQGSTPERPAVYATQERVLEAAIAASVIVDEPSDLVTMVRTTDSGGLKAILQVDRTYSPTSDDVQSKSFELDFPIDNSGNISPANVELVLESPGFHPPEQRRKIRVPPRGDSDVSVFMLTPKRGGTLRVNLRVLVADVEIGSRALVTTSFALAAAPSASPYGIISVPLKSSREFPHDVRELPLTRTGYARELPSPPLALPPTRPQQTGAPASPEPTRTSGRKGVWIGVLSSAAAIALVSTILIRTSENASAPADRSPETSAPTQAAPAPQKSLEEVYRVKDNLDTLHARADGVQNKIAVLSRQLQTRGLGLKPDVAASYTRLRQNLEESDRAIKMGNVRAARNHNAAAEKDLKFLENELSKTVPAGARQ